MADHQWRERTEGGELRYVRASRHAKTWRFQSQLKNEEFWIEHNPPLVHDLEALRKILWNKYQRGRLPYSQVEEIDAMLVQRNGEG